MYLIRLLFLLYIALPYTFITPPLFYSVAIIIICSFFIYNNIINKKIGILILIFWIIFVLPFIHIPPYLFYDFNLSKDPILWEIYVNPYMLDQEVITLTATLAAIGCIGFIIGIEFAIAITQYNKIKIEKDIKTKTLNLNIWIICLIIAVIFSLISTGGGNIFTETRSQAFSYKINFASSWMLSYAIFTYLISDIVFEQNNILKRNKQILIIIGIGYVAVFLQLLKGDRECLPFIMSSILVYFYYGNKLLNKKIRGILIIKIIILIYLIGTLIGIIRSETINTNPIEYFHNLIISYKSNYQITLSKLLHGTWSAVLLTPLSIAGDEVYKILPINYGKDYIDLINSIIPGFLADLIGYKRPIDSFTGPAWQMRYGIGGTHATVLPYINFRLFGILIITSIWAYSLVIIEKFSMRNMNVIKLSLIGMLITCAPHWLWYGEKSLINTIIMWIILSIIYIKFTNQKIYDRQI